MFKREICAFAYTCTCIYSSGKEEKGMLVSMRKLFTEKGQGIVEYAVIIAFVIAVAAYIFGNGGLRDEITKTFSKTASVMSHANTQ